MSPTRAPKLFSIFIISRIRCCRFSSPSAVSTLWQPAKSSASFSISALVYKTVRRLMPYCLSAFLIPLCGRRPQNDILRYRDPSWYKSLSPPWRIPCLFPVKNKISASLSPWARAELPPCPPETTPAWHPRSYRSGPFFPTRAI